MDAQRNTQRSELFTVRMWPEDMGEGRIEWRGKVQHAMSGESRYFREWAALIAFLGEILSAEEAVAKAGRGT